MWDVCLAVLPLSFCGVCPDCWYPTMHNISNYEWLVSSVSTIHWWVSVQFDELSLISVKLNCLKHVRSLVRCSCKTITSWPTWHNYNMTRGQWPVAPRFSSRVQIEASPKILQYIPHQSRWVPMTRGCHRRKMTEVYNAWAVAVYVAFHSVQCLSHDLCELF